MMTMTLVTLPLQCSTNERWLRNCKLV